MPPTSSLAGLSAAPAAMNENFGRPAMVFNWVVRFYRNDDMVRRVGVSCQEPEPEYAEARCPQPTDCNHRGKVLALQWGQGNGGGRNLNRRRTELVCDYQNLPRPLSARP